MLIIYNYTSLKNCYVAFVNELWELTNISPFTLRFLAHCNILLYNEWPEFFLFTYLLHVYEKVEHWILVWTNIQTQKYSVQNYCLTVFSPPVLCSLLICFPSCHYFITLNYFKTFFSMFGNFVTLITLIHCSLINTLSV